MPDFQPLPFPTLKTSSSTVNRAYRIAMADLLGNTRLFQDGLLDAPRPVILAGLDYDTPWTRDAAINVWNGLGLLWPDVSRNTLLAVLERQQGEPYIGGQYWDAIIWAVGAWAFYLSTGDREFLALAYEAIKNSLARFEQEEFDPALGLFRGPAVYGDGVAAYPDRYSPGHTSSILDWVAANPDKKAGQGFGIPMHTLSTNCVYARAYQIAGLMARELGLDEASDHQSRAIALANAIQKYFWNPEKGVFNYLVDPEGICDHQEGLGQAFALLFDLAAQDQAHSVLSNQHLVPAGIPCVWPSFQRYQVLGGFGRHSGTVWPFISAFWAEAALKYGRAELFEREFTILTDLINRDGQCAEIYHPQTTEIYGGLQESGSGANGMQWSSCARQSWSASAYLRLFLNGLLGMQISPAGINFHPHLPTAINHVQLSGVPYRACRLNLTVEGQGGQITAFHHNGLATPAFLPADLQGEHDIHIQVGPVV